MTAFAQMMARDPTLNVLVDVAAERRAQDRKWGKQNHPDFYHDCDPRYLEFVRDQNTRICEAATKAGKVTWEHILNEEVSEAYAIENDPAHLRRELIQVAAVCVAWVEAIDRRIRGTAPAAS